jgi:hypothetical protein
MRTLSKKAITLATTSFAASLVFGTLVLFGSGGANASTTTNCSIEKAVETQNDNGNNVITWTATGDCHGVTIDMIEVDANGTETTLQSDDLDTDLTSTFTYGTLAAGTSYDFRAHGKTESTKTPVSLKSVVAQN